MKKGKTKCSGGKWNPIRECFPKIIMKTLILKVGPLVIPKNSNY